MKPKRPQLLRRVGSTNFDYWYPSTTDETTSSAMGGHSTSRCTYTATVHQRKPKITGFDVDSYSPCAGPLGWDPTPDPPEI